MRFNDIKMFSARIPSEALNQLIYNPSGTFYFLGGKMDELGNGGCGSRYKFEVRLYHGNPSFLEKASLLSSYEDILHYDEPIKNLEEENAEQISRVFHNIKETRSLEVTNKSIQGYIVFGQPTGHFENF